MNTSRTLAALSLLLLIYHPITHAGEFTPPEGVTLLGADDLKATFIGNTAVGGYGWKESYSENGDISGKNKQGRPYQGRWWIESDRMCYRYRGGGYDTCSFIGIDADSVIHYYDVDRGKEKGTAHVKPGRHL